MVAAISLLAMLSAVLTLTARGQSFPLYSASNTMVPTHVNAAVLNDDGSVSAADPVLPVIEMKNLPLSEGIKRLLRQSQVDFSIDPRLNDWWTMTDAQGNHIQEPELNFRWTNITAVAALYRLLRAHHLALNEDPLTMVSQIKYSDGLTGQNHRISYLRSSAVQDLGFFEKGGSNTIPLIHFVDVPIMIGLQNLAREGQISYMLDPFLRYGEMDRYGQRIWEPNVTMHLTNATPEHAFIGVCVDNGLTVIRDPRSGVLLVRLRGHDVDFVNSDFYSDFSGISTDNIPLIEFNDAPLSDVLKAFARQAGMKCIISPRIDTGHPAREPRVNLRWENLTAPRGFAAICESYDLDIIKYPVSGFIRVEPAD